MTSRLLPADIEWLGLMLRSASREARQRGEGLMESGGVGELKTLVEGAEYEVAVDGPRRALVRILRDETGHCSPRCNCFETFPCAHVCGVIRALQADHMAEEVRRLSSGGGVQRPGGKGGAAVSFAQEVANAHRRKLTAAEVAFLKAHKAVYLDRRSTRMVESHDLKLLGLPLLGPGEPWVRICPFVPENEREFWLCLARVASQRKVPIPRFLEPVTDLELIQSRFTLWEQQRELLAWRESFRENTGLLLRPPSGVRGPCAVRLRLRPEFATLEWRGPSGEDFEELSTAAAEGLLRGIALAEASLAPEGGILFRILESHIRLQGTSRLRYDDPSQASTLAGILRTPSLDPCVVMEEGEPMVRHADPLRWKATGPFPEGGGYTIRLVGAGGVEAGPIWVAMPGVPPLYLSAAGLHAGPPPVQRKFLSQTQAARVPSAALESAEGLGLLQGLGAELPEALAARLSVERKEVYIRCRLKGVPGRSPEERCLFEIEACRADGSHAERWTGTLWQPVAPRPALLKEIPMGEGGMIVIEDRACLNALPEVLAPLRLRMDASGRMTVRVTSKFGEHFSRWISQLPDWVHVDLDGELQTLTASAVSGSVRLEAQEVDRDWFDLRVVVDVQETFLTPEEIQILLKARGALTRLEGKGWRRLRFDVSEAEDQQMARIGLNPADLDDAPQRLHVLQLADPAAERFLPAEQVALVRRRAEELQARVTPDVPAGISAPLRPYQVEGFHFLAYLSANRFGGILADDMGLGKTLQTLSWILWLRGRSPEEAGRPSLVVCPKSVMENWRSEAAKFAPALRVRVMSSGESVFENVGAADLHVMNYAHLRLLGDRLTEVRWLAVILDEGQFIKNPDSQSAVAARGLPADHRLVLTGTPIENRLMDLWSLMAFAMPGMLPSRGRFGRLYNAQRDPLARRRLSARVRPFLLRRTKGQVARDLPEKIEETILCELEGEQKLLYNAEFKRGQQLLLNLKTQKQLAKEQFQFLSSLLRLRQICCSPKLVNPATPEQGAKLEGLLELLESLLEEGHKVLVFSQFVSMLELIRSALEEQGLSPYYLTGETEDRGTLVDRFQADPNPGVFLISLRAGGFGLNLTSASYVVLFDPWWNPAVEAQAIDRTHRIGQQSTVVAYRFLIKGSVEEKMRELQRSKSSLAEQVLGEEKFSQSLTLEDLRFLYS